MEKKRIEWLDVSKGIGIILVVLGHAAISRPFAYYIFSFHMPLFYFLSGFLLNVDKYDSFLSFGKSRFKRLIIPYVVFSFISVILISIINGLQVDQIYFSNFFKALIVSKRNEIFYNVPLWFLTSLFTVEMMFYILRKVIKNNLILFGIVSIMGFIGYMYIQRWMLPMLPWTFDASVFYMVFYGLGHLAKVYYAKLKALKWLVGPLIFLNIAYLLSYTTVSNLITFANKSAATGYLLTLIISIAGIVTCAVVSEYLKDSHFLKVIGRNSMIIFILHMLCFVLINTVFELLNIKLQSSNIIGLIYTAITLLMLLPIIKFIDNRHKIKTQ